MRIRPTRSRFIIIIITSISRTELGRDELGLAPEQPPSPEQQQQKQIGEYTLLCKIGWGAEAAVFTARSATRELVVLKQMHANISRDPRAQPEAVRQVCRERERWLV